MKETSSERKRKRKRGRAGEKREKKGKNECIENSYGKHNFEQYENVDGLALLFR